MSLKMIKNSEIIVFLIKYRNKTSRYFLLDLLQIFKLVILFYTKHTKLHPRSTVEKILGLKELIQKHTEIYIYIYIYISTNRLSQVSELYL